MGPNGLQTMCRRRLQLAAHSGRSHFTSRWLQVALELHDIDGGLRRATDLLQNTAGFDTVVVEQDPQLKGSSLYTMFCTRENPLQASRPP